MIVSFLIVCWVLIGLFTLFYATAYGGASGDELFETVMVSFLLWPLFWVILLTLRTIAIGQKRYGEKRYGEMKQK